MTETETTTLKSDVDEEAFRNASDEERLMMIYGDGLDRAAEIVGEALRCRCHGDEYDGDKCHRCMLIDWMKFEARGNVHTTHFMEIL